MRLRPLSLAVALLAAAPAAAAELWMFEEAGCAWCARWTAEIGGIYDRTEEGRRAPLRRFDLHAKDWPEGALVSPPAFSPTFVLVDDDGREVGRILGHPGADFFFPMLQALLEDLPEPADG